MCTEKTGNMEDESQLLPTGGRSDDAKSRLNRQNNPNGDIDLPRVMVAEFLASFFLMFICLGGVYSSAMVTFDVVTVDRLLFIALCYGLVSYKFFFIIFFLNE